MNDKLLTISEVEAMTGFKKSWIYKKIKQGEFPANVLISSRARWSKAAVAEWIAQQAKKAA